MALESGAWKIGMAVADLLFNKLRSVYDSAPNSMRATSRKRINCPSLPRLTIISPKASLSCSRPCVVTVNSKPVEVGAGCCDKVPAAIWDAWLLATV
jgi:hypothetical protein